VVRVHPQLAARGLDNRSGEAVVVGVGVRADEQAHVLEAQSGVMQRPLELRASAPGSSKPASTSTTRGRRRSRRR